mgnify:CR=1 FL=1
MPFSLTADAFEISAFPESKAEAIIKKIISTVGLKPNFEVEQSDIYDASATVINGKRVIYYNPDFFDNLNQVTGSEWTSVSILAHEIGHHLNGHTLSGGEVSPAIELEADEFSGFVLNKMGASLSESQQAINRMAQSKDSKTHPAKEKRLMAIEKGWRNAGVQDDLIPAASSVKQQPESKPLPQTKSAEATTSKSNTRTSASSISRSPEFRQNYIRYTVRLNSQPGTVYYLTAQNNLVRYYENTFYIVGKIRSTGKLNYPYVLSGNNANFYVTKTGSIIDSNGRSAGYVKIYKG